MAIYARVKQRNQNQNLAQKRASENLNSSISQIFQKILATLIKNTCKIRKKSLNKKIQTELFRVTKVAIIC
jgi:thymidylate synthase ThyX